ncbi:hypothetical protein [Streptomyces spectabilis]|uniref:Uncharacterized protein n=1 Tax=Streptomyces spectabilis TaxID=68270 RepID=A0A516RF60_STRST|nr:hypothetical protein [Streptomyces spectabilis]QDQ14296.1 hypothetical protein FH965_30075 [Streptomyces spectabilis]
MAPITYTWWLSLAAGEPEEGHGQAETPEEARTALTRAVEDHLARIPDETERQECRAMVTPELGLWVVSAAARLLAKGTGATYNVPDVALVNMAPPPVQEGLFPDPSIISDALAKRYCLDHQLPVEDGWDGMAALERNGQINAELFQEISAAMEDTWDDELYAQLEALEAYAKHHGQRGPQGNAWHYVQPDYKDA